MRRRLLATVAVQSVMLSMIAAAPVYGQAVHGTIAVVKYETQRLVIAADSRHNFGKGAGSYRNDTACKIAALGEHAAFVSSGLVGYDNAGPRDQLATWRATDDARSHFAQIVEDRGEWKDEYLDALAISIGTSLVAHITELGRYSPATIQSATVGNLLTTALLATGRGDNITAAVVQVGVNEHKRAQLLSQRRITPAVCPPCALGRGEVVTEILGLSTQRARVEMNRLKRELAEIPDTEREIRRITRLVELSVAWLPDNAGVGGPVDVLEVRAGKSARWIQRKPQCPL
jgi:hypothetical protein